MPAAQTVTGVKSQFELTTGTTATSPEALAGLAACKRKSGGLRSAFKNIGFANIALASKLALPGLFPPNQMFLFPVVRTPSASKPVSPSMYLPLACDGE